jgi:nicotinamidase-related amidase
MQKPALLLVDIQYDFLPPDGSLAVPDGDKILPPVYRLLDEAEKHFGIIVASLVGPLFLSIICLSDHS